MHRSTARLRGPRAGVGVVAHAGVEFHVRHGDGEAVFDVEESVELRESQDMKLRELAKAQRLAQENRQLILEKWHEHLG